jgi:hypothetical protein
MVEHADTTLLQKLGIREGTRMTTVNAPADFRTNLGELPLAVEWANRVRPPLDLIVAFHTRRATMIANWKTLTAAMQPDGAIWIAWPKKISGVSTDLTDDLLREDLLKTGWVDNKVCAIDETYTALRFVLRRENRRKKPPTTAKPAKLRKTRPGSHR